MENKPYFFLSFHKRVHPKLGGGVPDLGKIPTFSLLFFWWKTSLKHPTFVVSGGNNAAKLKEGRPEIDFFFYKYSAGKKEKLSRPDIIKIDKTSNFYKSQQRDLITKGTPHIKKTRFLSGFA